MEILFVFNILLSLTLLFTPVWFSRSWLKLPWTNPYTISFAISLPVQVMKLLGGPLVLIDDGLFDNGFQYALLMNNLQCVVQMFSLVFFFWFFSTIKAERFLPMKRIVLNESVLKRGRNVFLLSFFVSLVLLAVGEFGLSNWLMNPRMGYQLYRVGQGQWYALAVSSLAVSFLLALLARPFAREALVITIIYVCLGYFLGSKGTMLELFVTGITFLWFLKWKHFGRIFLIGLPMLFGLLIFNLSLAFSDGFDAQSILEYFDYYKNAADYYREYLNGHIPLFYGEVTLSSFWSYVPRGFSSEKPFVYGILLVNEIFYPGQAELTNTPAFGGAVEQFADFGVIGVIIFSFFSAQVISKALFSYLIFRKPGLNFSKVSLATVMLFLVQFVSNFGLYFPSGLYLVLLLAVLGILMMCRIKFVAKNIVALKDQTIV